MPCSAGADSVLDVLSGTTIAALPAAAREVVREQVVSVLERAGGH